MEIRHLRYLVAVSEHGSFRSAADHLNVSHPPLHRQLRELEATLGVALFDRHATGVTLTPAGRILADHARQIIELIAVAERTVRAAGAATSLRIAHSHGYVDASIPPTLAMMAESHPEIDVTLEERHAHEQFSALAAGELDIGYCAIRPLLGYEDIAFAVIRSSPAGVAVPRGHRLAGAATVAIEQIAGEPFVALPRHIVPEYHHWLDALFPADGARPRIVKEVDTPAGMLTLVSAGVGLAILPALSFGSRADLEFKPLVPQPPPIDYHVAWRTRGDMRTIEVFLACLADQFDNGGMMASIQDGRIKAQFAANGTVP